MKRQARDWEKVFAKHISEKGLVSKKTKKTCIKKRDLYPEYTKNFYKSIIKRQKTILK